MGDMIIDALADWIKSILTSGILSNLSDLFGQVNDQVTSVAGVVGQTPMGWNAAIFNMIKNISDTVVLPIAGLILSFVMTLELIQIIMDKNNGHDFDLFMLYKWIFKSMFAVLIVTNTWNIVMSVFDIAQSVVQGAAGIIAESNIDSSLLIPGLQNQLAGMGVGELVSLWMITLLLRFSMWPITIIIFIVVYGRMIEIYLLTSMAPIPMATMMGKELGNIGQNYLRSLVALGFQGFLIIICVAIYSVMLQGLVVGDDIFVSLLYYVAYTVLLCFTLLKTSALSKSIFNAH